MDFIFLSSFTFETWDWSNPLEKGIGGSETSHVEMAARLALRGHEVYSYAPTPFDGPRTDPAGVPWEHTTRANYTRPGVWVIYRDPEKVDLLEGGQPAWLICQDVHYRDQLTEARAARFTRIVALCNSQADYLRRMYPFAADKIYVSSNGIRSALIKSLQADQEDGEFPARNPKRLMFASSPDRGLWALLHIFERAREIVPDLELHVFYGFDNILKVIEKHPRLNNMREQLLNRMDQPGIVHHGRIGQFEMAKEWLQSGVWCHPSQFTETSCITCMDAQASGAIPLTTPVWAVGENVNFGVLVEGFPDSDPLTKARYVVELCDLVSNPDKQQRIREQMIPWALDRFDWDLFAMQWEGWAREDLVYPVPAALREAVSI